MAKSKKNKQPSLSEMSPEQLKELDNDTLVGIVMRLWEQNQQLSESLRQIVYQLNPRKTEHFENPEQLRLFNADDADRATATDDATDESSEDSVQGRKKNSKKKGHTRNPMPAHLPRKRITGAELAACDLNCKHCSSKLERLHDVLRNSRLECVPASVFIEDFFAMIYKCTGCGSTSTVEPPSQTIENGAAGPALLTDIAVARFVDHMPYNRQEQRFARMGVPIARSTMVGWMKWVADKLRPLYERMKEFLLRSKAIATDDTPVKVQDRWIKRKKAKKLKIKIGRMWIYRGDEQHPFNLFDYTEGRGRVGPMTFLAGFKGFLQGDCFSGNLAVCAETGGIFVACLVHARRYFIKALPNNKSACQEVLQMFAEVFEIERAARELGLSADEIKLMREQEAKPILGNMKKWLDEQVLVALPKSSFGKAVNYCLNNWTYLTNYLLDGDLRADNNLAEQEMKQIACGRKNWLFLGSDEGGRTAEVLLSLVSTCKRHDVNPTEYLRDVIQTLTNDPATDLDQLLPHNWKKNRENSEITGCHITPKMALA